MSDKNAQNYGILPMSMGKYLYESVKQRTKYQLMLMIFANEQTIDYAKAYAGYDKDGKLDMNSGIVSLFIDEANDAAEHAGKAIMQDSYSSLIQGVVGLGATALSIGSLIPSKVETGLNANLENVQSLQKRLNEPMNEELGIGKPIEELENPISQKIDELANVGGDAFDKQQVLEDRRLQNDAIDAAKCDPEKKAQIEKNLEKRLQDLKRTQNRQADGTNQKINLYSMVQRTAEGIAEIAPKTKKARYNKEQQQEQAASQVLQNVEQKQSSITQQQQQQAKEYQQAALSEAASYGQMVQTRAG